MFIMKLSCKITVISSNNKLYNKKSMSMNCNNIGMTRYESFRVNPKK